MRDDEEESMDNWNEEKLKEVVEKKHGMAKNVPTTDIVNDSFITLLFYFIIIFNVIYMYFSDL